MFGKKEILSILRREMPRLRSQFHVNEIALFGSFARNEGTPASDIDFLVNMSPPPDRYIQTKEALRLYLSELFGRRIDLANPRSLKPHYKDRILQQAVYA